MQQLKLRIIYNDKVVGYERLTDTGWEWMWLELNPDNGERWTRGVINDSHKLIRNLLYGIDDNGKEVYVGDIVDFDFDSVIFVKNGYDVIFQDGAFLVNKPNFKPLLSDCSRIRVVGNIYETPKLVSGRHEA